MPLLVEHDAREELREEGLRLVLDEADTGAPTSHSDDVSGGEIQNTKDSPCQIARWVDRARAV